MPDILYLEPAQLDSRTMALHLGRVRCWSQRRDNDEDFLPFRASSLEG